MGSDDGADREEDLESDPDPQDGESSSRSDPDRRDPDESFRSDPDPGNEEPSRTDTGDDRPGRVRPAEDPDLARGPADAEPSRTADRDRSGQHDDRERSGPRDVRETPGPHDDRNPSGDGRSTPPQAGEQSTGSRGGETGSPGREQGLLRWLWTTNHPVVLTVREVFTTLLAVMVIGLVLFAISGVWPPLVAVESGSMDPHMEKGDLVFVMDEDRLGSPPEAVDGVVTHRAGTESGHWSFGDHGNVVVFRPNGRDGTPIIHRAEFWVEEGDNWVAQADPAKLGRSTSCEQVRTCPAPHDGYITKGDANAAYDQVAGRTTVVKPGWVRGTARVRVPWLGCIRLELAGQSCF